VDTTVISSYTYNVNHLGQRTGVNKAGTAFSSTRDIAWGYNNKGEVVKAAHSADAAFNRAYQYDGIGNRIQSGAGILPAAITTYTPNALNQYSAISGGGFQPPSPTYDADGNQIDAQVQPLGSSSLESCVYSWDAENRLIQTTVGTNGPVVRFYYDAQSRRIAQTTGTATTLYIYDGWNPIAEYAQSGTGILPVISKTYTWGMDLSGSMQGAGGVGGLLAVTDSTGTYYPTFDGNGNISEYLDSTGAVAAHYEYDPFGNTTVATGTKKDDFAHRFSTKPLDPTTGLYYYGYRYYDPLTGRWPSRDPIEEMGGENLYGFVVNDGVNKLDYLGLDFIAVGESGIGSRKSPFSHAIIQRWESPCPLEAEDLHSWTTEDSLEDLLSTRHGWRINLKMIQSIELSPDRDRVYEANVRPVSSTWGVFAPDEHVKGFVLSYINSEGMHLGEQIAPVFDGKPEDIEIRWNRVIAKSFDYPHAERSQGNTSRFPQSIYGDPGFQLSSNYVPFNNSNTFVRWVLNQSGINWQVVTQTRFPGTLLGVRVGGRWSNLRLQAP